MGEPLEATVDDEDADEQEAAEDEEDDRPDLLLRESARIVGDMVELDGDVTALARQFSLLGKPAATDTIN